MSEMADAIRELIETKGFSADSVRQTIENAIKAAYKRTFGTADNCIVKFADDMSDVTVYSRKTIVDGVYDPVAEIELEEALQLTPECEEGDEIDIQVDPRTFDRSAVSTGKQAAHQGLNESFKDTLYNEYKDKVGEIIIGYVQREYRRNIYVDLGKDGKVEGVIPADEVELIAVADAADKLDEEDAEKFLEEFEKVKAIEDKVVKYFFWLKVPEDTLKDGEFVEAEDDA